MQTPERQSKDFPNSFFRVTTKGLYVRDGKVLMCHDFVVPERPTWELPGGGLDFGENIQDALRREINEEMGLEVTWIAEKPMHIWTARREESREMEWFYVLLLAYRIEIKSLDVLISTDECRDIKFFSKGDLLNANDLAIQIQPLAQMFNPTDFAPET
jgi:8-oxo-dGTP diphosphatase